MKLLSACAVAMVALSLAGCRSKMDECNYLVRVVNENHVGEDRLGHDARLDGSTNEALELQLAARVADMKRDLNDDENSVAALHIMNPTVPEVRKLRDDLLAGFKTRLDGEQIIVNVAEDPSSDTAKATSGLTRVNMSVPLLHSAYAGVTSFCKSH